MKGEDAEEVERCRRRRLGKGSESEAQDSTPKRTKTQNSSTGI